MPKVRADNPTLSPNLLMKEASALWQTSKEREIHMNSKTEHADAKCKKSMESGSRQKKTLVQRIFLLDHRWVRNT